MSNLSPEIVMQALRLLQTRHTSSESQPVNEVNLPAASPSTAASWEEQWQSLTRYVQRLSRGLEERAVHLLVSQADRAIERGNYSTFSRTVDKLRNLADKDHS